MRLLMITQDFPPETGGIQTYSMSHAKNLAGYCDWFGVICPEKPDSVKSDKDLDFDIIRLKARNDLLIFTLLRKLNGILEEHPVDATFHSQWQTAAAGIRARENGLIDKVFAAAHIRELLFNPFEPVPVLKGLFTRYRNRILQKIDHFYPVSDYTAGVLNNLGVDESRITVIINGTDPDQFFPSDSADLRKQMGLEKKQVLLTITRLVERKGIDTVLASLPRVIREIPDVHYMIVGDGDDRTRLQKLAEFHQIVENVTFAGRVPYAELNDYYNVADLFVMPSRTQIPDVEGFGIVFLEANACGLPVIGSDSGGIPSAIRNGITGFIVPEGNHELLAEKIIELFKNPGLSKKIGLQGRKWVTEEANWNRLSRNLFDDLNVRLLNQSR
jgi:phosphatidyl-myo-inositol dimannoside synthase